MNEASPVVDANVRDAIAHWAPRLIANGIDYNDFRTTTARISRWRDWSAEWSRTAGTHEAIAHEASARGSVASAAEAYVRAALCHHFGKFVFFDDMEQYARANAATIVNYRKAAPHLSPSAELVAIPYAGNSLPGYLRRPPGIARPPVAIIICGLDSVKEEMNSFEPLFHARGMATLTFDGPGQGEAEALPIEPAFEKVAGAVIDFLESRDDVDAGRVGAIGISLGGYYAARAAAHEPRLTCAAASGGPYDFGEEFETMPLISRQAFTLRSHSPDEASAAERAKALTLREAAGRIERPFMIIFGAKDRLIPKEQAERLYREIPSPAKVLHMFAEGNHVCNNMPYAWRPLVADWIGSHLKA
ncbi:alpha/beta hydrolase family protein [Ancylobacter terrae]|uniref:alpha/beta hydrolase family protein n=1 Tax=Ancylobacter sp. sgz301288 TaxID=3342077 RepID=UPI00385F6339